MDQQSTTRAGSETTSFELALLDWRAALDPDAVFVHSATLESYACATFATSQRVLAVLKPRNVTQVQECLRIATRHRVSIYPISSGKNWGYGSRVPPADNCVVMDLGEMRAIADFD